MSYDAFDINDESVAVLYAIEPSSNDLPTEIMLFGPGVTETSKGDFLMDKEAGEAIMSAFKDQGMDRLPFDAAHGMLKSDSPEANKALGWFVPEVRELSENQFALFAADIEWTEPTIKALGNREWRFYSPAILFEKDSGRIKALINCALTNLPATKNQRPLVLDGLETEKEENTNMSEKTYMTLLGASDEASAEIRAKELVDFESAILTALDCKADEVSDKIVEIQKVATDAIAELAAIEVQRKEEAKAAKIAELSASGKLPPAYQEFAKTLSDEQLEKFTDITPSVPTKVEEGESGKVETLSDEDKVACKSLGISEDDFKKTKEMETKENI